MRNEIPSLYVLKGIAAICVVLAHTSLGDYSRLVQVVPVDIGITSIFMQSQATSFSLKMMNVCVENCRRPS